MQNSETAYFAAIDLGSNSFHMMIARVNEGNIETVDRVKEMVQIARGMKGGEIAVEAQERALECLTRFSERLKNIPRHQVRAVATKSLRTANNAQDFLSKAKAALGHPIFVISGYEEARLVYKGLSHSVNNDADKRLVIDIGGGSTELIIGQKEEPVLLESLSVGCVTYSDQFELKGNISAEQMHKAFYSARMKFGAIRNIYAQCGWDIVYGTAGTMKAVAELVSDKCGGATITLEALDELRHKITDGDGKILSSLAPQRRDVIPAGVAILWALFKEFRFEQIRVADATLKEGLIYDTIGRFNNHDARNSAIEKLQKQYRVDVDQAKRVTFLTLEFWRQILSPEFPGISRTKILNWASSVHELGLAISHAGHHKHSFYILHNSDLAGFGRYEQLILANLVREQRKKLSKSRLNTFDTSAQEALKPMILCLRLSVIFNRRREDIGITPKLSNDGEAYCLRFPENWLETHPLTHAGILEEIEHLKEIEIKLKLC